MKLFKLILGKKVKTSEGSNCSSLLLWIRNDFPAPDSDQILKGVPDPDQTLKGVPDPDLTLKGVPDPDPA
jgi:hypothetical protein